MFVHKRFFGSTVVQSQIVTPVAYIPGQTTRIVVSVIAAFAVFVGAVIDIIIPLHTTLIGHKLPV